MATHTSVDSYFASLPEATGPVVAEVRRVIAAAVPGGVEVIRYDMPTVTLEGTSVVHYAAWKKHLAIYPGPAEGTALDLELAPYRQPKGTLSFPFSEPMPLALIGRTVSELLRQRTSQVGDPETGA